MVWPRAPVLESGLPAYSGGSSLRLGLDSETLTSEDFTRYKREILALMYDEAVRADRG
ncbi:MAG: hypothetical protein OXM87_04035 [Truepera sp.]|nr:hypothetical protein [Truepera sp.]